jgi:hypothetical protein
MAFFCAVRCDLPSFESRENKGRTSEMQIESEKEAQTLLIRLKFSSDISAKRNAKCSARQYANLDFYLWKAKRHSVIDFLHFNESISRIETKAEP